MNGPKLDEVSIFFPCHNEAPNIEQLVQQARKVFNRFAETFEVIVVDDGSTDGTGEIADRLSAAHPDVRVVHQKNQGYGGALKSGFRAARLKWVFFSDGDLQFDLAEFEKFVPYAAAADMVIGYRLRRADGYKRLIIQKMLKIWNRLFLGFPMRFKDVDCAFKLIRMDRMDGIMPLESDGAMISTELMLKAHRRGLRIAQVGVRHFPRVAGVQSGSNPKVILKAVRETWKLRRLIKAGAR